MLLVNAFQLCQGRYISESSQYGGPTISAQCLCICNNNYQRRGQEIKRELEGHRRSWRGDGKNENNADTILMGEIIKNKRNKTNLMEINIDYCL